MILALLVGCALRRNELAELDVENIQQREGKWVLADLEGKDRRIVAIPIWVKEGINAWMTADGMLGQEEAGQCSLPGIGWSSPASCGLRQRAGIVVFLAWRKLAVTAKIKARRIGC